MNTEKLTPLQERAANVVDKVLQDGTWIDNQYLANHVAEMGLSALKRRSELEAAQANDNGPEATKTDGDIDENGWLSESWAAWRLVLRTGDNPAVIYFSRKPTYAESKAFAKAAAVPFADAVIEERPE